MQALFYLAIVYLPFYSEFNYAYNLHPVFFILFSYWKSSNLSNLTVNVAGIKEKDFAIANSINFRDRWSRVTTYKLHFCNSGRIFKLRWLPLDHISLINWISFLRFSICRSFCFQIAAAIAMATLSSCLVFIPTALGLRVCQCLWAYSTVKYVARALRCQCYVSAYVAFKSPLKGINS